MKEYHKIHTVFKRDHKTNQIIEGDYSLPEFDYLKDNTWVFTEKVDGTNIRVMWNDETVVFGGKTDNAALPVFLLYKLQELFDGTAKRKLFSEVFPNPKPDDGQVCLYGEGYGAKIQKAGSSYNPNGVDFVLFDVKIGHWWLQRKDVEDIAERLGIKVVPLLGEGTLSNAIELVRGGFESTWGPFQAEGIVARPKVELKARNGDRIITKIKCRDFKLTGSLALAS